MELLTNVEVGKIHCKALFDTGAHISVIRHGLLLNAMRKDIGIRLVDAKGETIPVFGAVSTQIHLGNFTATHTFVEAAIQNDVILGMDFLLNNHCIIDLLSNRLYIGDEEVEFDQPRGESDSVARLNHLNLSLPIQKAPHDKGKGATASRRGRDDAGTADWKPLPVPLETL